VDFATMMALEPHGIDVWVGAGPQYPWGGLYGGQIVAQALKAAAETVEPQFLPHSLHAYFIRRGDHTQPVRFEVDRVRNGRSFVTRAVVARQSVGAILNMSASFQVHEEALDVQTATLPDIPGPDDCRSDRWTPWFDRRFAPTPGPGQVAAWTKVDAQLGEDPVAQACALAYLSDDLPMDAVAALHPESELDDAFHRKYYSASLDHSLWFHRPLDAAQWHAQWFTCHGMTGARGLSSGYVFAADGTHVATITQEALFRKIQDKPGKQ
jgi:acyl-CoA thioesterase-2